jgi:hypothetical protein
VPGEKMHTKKFDNTVLGIFQRSRSNAWVKHLHCVFSTNFRTSFILVLSIITCCHWSCDTCTAQQCSPYFGFPITSISYFV